MILKFPYKKFLLPERSSLFGHSYLRPILPIELGWKSKRLRYEALVDSGADFCIFDAEIGDYLGIDVRSGESFQFGGIQAGRQPATTYLHTVILAIGGQQQTVPVTFSYDIADTGIGVLGQRGFFDQFVVTFKLDKEVVELKTPRGK